MERKTRVPPLWFFLCSLPLHGTYKQRPERIVYTRRSKGINNPYIYIYIYIHQKKHVVDLPRSHPQQYYWTLAPSDQIADAPERISPSRSCSKGSICTLEQASVKSYCTMHQTIVSFTYASTCNWFSNYNYYTNYIYTSYVAILNYDYHYHYFNWLQLQLHLQHHWCTWLSK